MRRAGGGAALSDAGAKADDDELSHAKARAGGGSRRGQRPSGRARGGYLGKGGRVSERARERESDRGQKARRIVARSEAGGPEDQRLVMGEERAVGRG